MEPTLFEVFRTQSPRTELDQIRGAQLGELVQQLSEGLAFAFAELGKAVEGLKSLAFATSQDALRAWNPVYAFAMGEVSDDVVHAPGIFAFVAMSPDFGLVAEKGVECCRSAGEEGDGVAEVECHGEIVVASGLARPQPSARQMGANQVTERILGGHEEDIVGIAVNAHGRLAVLPGTKHQMFGIPGPPQCENYGGSNRNA